MRKLLVPCDGLFCLVGMDSRNATKIGIAIGIVASILTAGVVAAVVLIDDSESEEFEILAVQSWNMQNHSYYPHYWINVSDDLKSPGGTYGRVLTEVTLQLINRTTGIRDLTASGGALTSYEDGITRFSGSLDLQKFQPGVFDVHVYVNVSSEGAQDNIVPKRFHGVCEVTLPTERPLLPQITSMSVEFNELTNMYHYAVAMVDPDGDGDTLDVYLSGKGYTKYHVRVNNSDNLMQWSFEGDVNVTLSHELYDLWGQVTDGDGPYSMRWTIEILP